MKVSVVICTRNRPREVLICLHSLMEQSYLPDEIIIVDASDTQELKSLLAQNTNLWKVRANYFYTDKPGLTRQRNIGVRESHGDIVIFSDDDVVFDRDYVKEIVRVFENDRSKSIGGVTGDIKNIKKPERLYQFINHIFFLPMFGDGRFRPSGFPTYPHGIDRIIEVEFLSGCSAYRREVLDEFSFDENLEGYCYMEDVDFSYRVSRKYRNIYTPYAKLIHHQSSTARGDRVMLAKMLVMNHYYLFKKNFPQTPARRLAFCISLVGMLVTRVTVSADLASFKGTLVGIKDIVLNKWQK